MRYLTLLVIFGFLNYNVQSQTTYNSWNVELLGYCKADTFDVFKKPISRFSSCWGYTANGKEYAIVGSSEGTMFFDVTDPSNIKLVDQLQGHSESSTWREYKTYKNYLYCVSDDGRRNKMDIVDLSYLPDSIHVVYSSDEFVNTGHTVFVDNDKLYIGIRNHNISMSIFDLSADPTNPIFLADLVNYPGVHDMFVRNDTVYASCGFDGLYIFKWNGSDFDLISTLVDYPENGYNHSSILTPDGKTLIFTDEVPQGLPGKSLDVTDITSPVINSIFYPPSKKATPHNPFLARNNKFVMSNYEDGAIVYDYSNPDSIVMTGYFDTHWQEDFTNAVGDYNGVWSVYTELPSGNMIAVDMENGLYMLDPSQAYDLNLVSKPNLVTKPIHVYPSPVSDLINLDINQLKAWTEMDYAIYSFNGQLIRKASGVKVENLSQLKVNDLFPGMYMIRLNNHKNSFTASFIKQ